MVRSITELVENSVVNSCRFLPVGLIVKCDKILHIKKHAAHFTLISDLLYKIM